MCDERRGELAYAMRFAIDGRYIQDHFPGIGRYTYNLVVGLARLYPQDEFILFHDPAADNTRYDVNAIGEFPNVVMVPVSSGVFSLLASFPWGNRSLCHA